MLKSTLTSIMRLLPMRMAHIDHIGYGITSPNRRAPGAVKSAIRAARKARTMRRHRKVR